MRANRRRQGGHPGLTAEGWTTKVLLAAKINELLDQEKLNQPAGGRADRDPAVEGLGDQEPQVEWDIAGAVDARIDQFGSESADRHQAGRRAEPKH